MSAAGGGLGVWLSAEELTLSVSVKVLDLWLQETDLYIHQLVSKMKITDVYEDD